MADYTVYLAKSLNGINATEDGFHLRIKSDPNGATPPYYELDNGRITVERQEDANTISYEVYVWLKEVSQLKPVIYKDWIFSEEKVDFSKISGAVTVYMQNNDGSEDDDKHENLVYQSMPEEYPIG